MIRVTIELVPGGYGTPILLHVIEVWNDLAGTLRSRGELGDYGYHIGRKGVEGGPEAALKGTGKRGHITGFPRTRLNAVRLLQRVLNDAYPKGK